MSDIVNLFTHLGISAVAGRLFLSGVPNEKMAMMANVLEQYVNNVTTLSQQGNRCLQIVLRSVELHNIDCFGKLLCCLG